MVFLGPEVHKEMMERKDHLEMWVHLDPQGRDLVREAGSHCSLTGGILTEASGEHLAQDHL